MLDLAKRAPLIWIVDDSPTEAAFTERSLGMGYRFERFTDGSVVVERLSTSAQHPDLVLLDWVMPGMPGDEVCKFLRSRPQTRDLPIIMVTASRMESANVVEGLALGANDYVARPYAPEELRARVNAALRAKHLADTATRERQRLATVNRVGHALFRVEPTSASVESRVHGMLDELARTLKVSICDGCAIVALPGPLAAVMVSRHRNDPSGALLAGISTMADPMVHAFASSADAKASLPEAYADYIDHFGLRGLAILPFPTRGPIQGVVTLTRDRDAQPFDADDIATIETCIEYTGLAVESALRYNLERIAREQLDTLLEALPVGIVATDHHGAVTLINLAARDLLPTIGSATSLADVFRLPGWFAGDGSKIVDTQWVQDDPGSLAQSAELQLCPPGEDVTRTVAVSAVPLRDANRAIAGRVIVLQDVSAERAVAAERERIAKFQDEIIGIVGHDLRTPLNAMVAGTELLGAMTDDTPALSTLKPTVRRLGTSVDRMTRIVEQLLDVTRARLGAGIPISPREMSLLPLVTTLVDELALAQPTAMLEVIANSEISGTWDPDRLGQVVSNLMSNAIQYGRVGAPITIELARNGDQAVIRVCNANRDKPIPAETQATLFAPYRRGDTTGHSTGLGLGLYIVHEIVRAHGGTITVESSERGTDFTVILPNAKAGTRARSS